jgi:hypothetical protein
MATTSSTTAATEGKIDKTAMNQWITPKNLAHQPLIEQAAFDQAQEMLTRRARSGTSPQRVYRTRTSSRA